MKRDLKSSLVSRFAASTAALATALVLLAVAYFVVVNWSFLQGSFEATLRGYGMMMAAEIAKDPEIAQKIAKSHSIGIVVTNPDGKDAFDHDGRRVDPETFQGRGYRRVDAISHDGRHVSFYWDRSALAKAHISLLAGLVVVLLVMVGVTYAFQLTQLRPLRWLTEGVEAVSRGDFTTRVPVVRRDEIGEAAQAFNQMTQRIQQMIEDRERLLADVGHELRSPLARIKVALELMPGGEKRDSVERDVREMEALTAILLESEKLRIELDRRVSEEIDLVAVAQEVVAAYGDRAPGVVLEGRDESAVIRGDARMLRVLIQNIVENAVKFSLDDSRPAEVRVAGGAESITLEVVDDGKGIPEDERTRVFEPFVKLDPARGHRSGYGLGLNLCKRIVEAHRGAIEITGNPEGRGALVRVTLPREEVTV